MKLPIFYKLKILFHKLFVPKKLEKKKSVSEFKKELKGLSVNQIIDKIIMVNSLITGDDLIDRKLRKKMRAYPKNKLIKALIDLTVQYQKKVA
jgi:hypothetical protein